MSALFDAVTVEKEGVEEAPVYSPQTDVVVVGLAVSHAGHGSTTVELLLVRGGVAKPYKAKRVSAEESVDMLAGLKLSMLAGEQILVKSHPDIKLTCTTTAYKDGD